VVANDFDIDGDTLYLVPDSVRVQSGQATFVVDGNSISVTPISAAGEQNIVISYVVADNVNFFTANLSNANLYISVTPTGGTNKTPTAVDDEATVTQGEFVTVDVLANDTDADNDTLTIDSANVDFVSGTVVVNDDQTITFTPSQNVLGQVVINYTIKDSSNATASAELVVLVESSTVLTGDQNNNTLQGKAADELIFGKGGNDTILGGNGDDTLTGGEGDDFLMGDEGDDLLIGDIGNDSMVGGLGRDVYVFNVGDGQDVINTFENPAKPQPSLDVLSFGLGIKPEDIELMANQGQFASNLVLKVKGTTDQITIENYFLGDFNKIQMVEFADGTLWTQQDITQFLQQPPQQTGNLAFLTDGTEDTAYTLLATELLQGFIDANGDYLSIVDLQASNGTLLDNRNDTYTFTPNPNFSGIVTLSYQVSDGHGGIINAGNGFIIQAVNDDPTGNANAILTQVIKQVVTTYTVSANDLLQGFSDVDGDTLSLSSLTADHAAIVNNNNGSYTLTIDANYDGAVTLNYDVTDGLGGILAATQSFVVMVDTTGTKGAETLVGGQTDDTYIINNRRDMAIESSVNGGTDTVSASLSYLLGDNLENLMLTGIDALSGTGNELNNVLTGNNGKNRLLAGDGNDTLSGGAGSDTLNGGSGADQLFGGTGNDTFIVENTADMVTEFANEGFDTVNSFISYTLTANIERLILEGIESLNGFGNDLDNTLNGNNANNWLVGGLGNDTLEGKGGADILEGGLGDDIYYVDEAGDTVTELAGEGIDKVNSSVNHTLTINVEQLYLTGIAALLGVGNDLDNIIYGNSGNNALNGGIGNDSLNGGLGNDILQGGAGNDTLVGGLGDDTYRFGTDSDRDTINNQDSAGNDVLALAAGIGAEQVWLRQLGEDLEISIIGTASSVKIQGWYTDNSQNHLDSLKLSEGNILLFSEVQTLVNAMAAFTPPPVGQTSLTTEQRAALSTTIAIAWEVIS
jgi:Ca2+-binding RTX toxin-like protein